MKRSTKRFDSRARLSNACCGVALEKLAGAKACLVGESADASPKCGDDAFQLRACISVLRLPPFRWTPTAQFGNESKPGTGMFFYHPTFGVRRMRCFCRGQERTVWLPRGVPDRSIHSFTPVGANDSVCCMAC